MSSFDLLSALITVLLVALCVPILLFLERFLPSEVRPYFNSPERLRLQTEIDQLKSDISSMTAHYEERIAELKEHYEQKIEEIRRHHIHQMGTIYNMMNEMRTQNGKRNGQMAKEAPALHVLAIWPHYESDPLDTRGAAAGLYNSGISYTPLMGPLRRRDIVAAIRRNSYNILQIDAHGEKEAIYLDDATPTLPGWWVRLVKDYSIDLVALIACHSESQMGDALLREGAKAVITVSGDIADDAAVDFVAALYENIANGDSLSVAVERAKLVMDFDQAQMIRHWGKDLWTH